MKRTECDYQREKKKYMGERRLIMFNMRCRGFSYRQISKIFGLSIETVRQRVEGAQAYLAHILQFIKEVNA